MSTTVFDQSQAMALKLGNAAAQALFCTFKVYKEPDGDLKKIPLKRDGTSGVKAITPSDALFTADDVWGMEAIQHGQYFGLNMHKPLYVEGRGYLVCIDVDTKRKFEGDTTHQVIQNLGQWVQDSGALTEKSISGKGGRHVFVWAKTADNILRKYPLALGQEIEIFGLDSSDKKSVLLTGEAMKGEIVEVDNLDTFLIELGITKEMAPPKATAPAGNLDFLNLALAGQYVNDPQVTYLKAVEALKLVSDSDYDQWIKVGQALHDEFGEQGRALWMDWSSGGAKYQGEGDIDTHWKSFHQGGGVGIGTLFHIAAQHGYHPMSVGLVTEPNQWEEPQPLIAKVENDAYPIHALPEFIKLAVEEAASFTQSPISMLASSAITAISLALQGHFNVRRAEKLVAPLALYFLVIADSGERKTAGDKLFTQGIEDFVNEQMELAKPELQKYRADLQIWEAKHSGIKAQIHQLAKGRQPTKAEENSLYDLEVSKPQPPKIPKLLLKDISPEKLGLSLAVDWPVAGIVTSEAGVFFGSHAMSKDVVMRTLSLLNILWDGGSISSERKVAEGFNIRSARLTMGLAIQEGTLREAFIRTGPLVRDTGFLSRNLLCWPTSNMGNRPFKEAPKKWPHLEAFNARIRAILNAPLPMKKGVLEPVEIGLSDSAKQDWVGYHDAVESQLKASGDYFEIKDVAAKSADNVARLAGLFEKFNPNGGTSISQDSLQRAAQICAWHLEEARRFLGELVLPQDLSDAFRLEKWLVIYSMDKETVSQRDAQNAGPVRDKKRLGVALAELESLNRIRTVQEGKRKLIKVNPMVMK